MRIAHMSDLHFSAGNLEESLKCFSASVDMAIEAKADAAVITGDSTDHALSAHDPALVALARQTRRLADVMPVLMLQGTFSHEPPGTLAMLEMVGAKHPIRKVDQIGQVALRDGRFIKPVNGLTWDVANDGAADLVFTAMPTVNKAHVIPEGGDASEEYVDRLSAVMRSFGPINAALMQGGIPTMGLGHGTIDGCETEHGIPMAGFDHEFSLDRVFSTGADAFALGHIHKHQHWMLEGSRLQRAAYAGSIGRFHHGEIGAKGFLLWDVQPAKAEFQFMELPAQVTMDIRFDGPPDMAEIARIAEQCKGARVRVVYEVDEEHRSSIDRQAIVDALKGAADVQITGKVNAVQRRRAEGVSNVSSLEKRLQAWAEVSGSDAAPLLQRLEVLDEQPEAIAQTFLGELI